MAYVQTSLPHRGWEAEVPRTLPLTGMSPQQHAVRSSSLGWMPLGAIFWHNKPHRKLHVIANGSLNWGIRK